MSHYSFYRQCMSYLTSREQRDYYLVLVLGVMSAMGELLGLASIVPVITVITGSEMPVYMDQLTEYTSHDLAVSTLGALCILTLILSAIINATYSFARNRYAMRVGARLSTAAIRNYLSQDPVLFWSRSEAEFSRNIGDVGGRVSMGVVQNSLHMVSRFALTAIAAAGLLWINPLLTVAICLTLAVLYTLIHVSIKNYIQVATLTIFSDSKFLHRTKINSYKAFRLAKISGAENYVADIFSHYRKRSARLSANISIMGELPKNVIETAGLVVLVVMALIMDRSIVSDKIIPNMSIFALAAYRILPSLQQIFQGYNNLTAVKALEPTIANALEEKIDNKISAKAMTNGAEKTQFNILELKTLSFSYLASGRELFKSLNQKMELKGVWVLQAPSGAGKSTLFDLLMGFQRPIKGSVQVDGVNLADLKNEWWENISYVPSSYVSFGSSLKSEVSFGRVGEVDNHRLKVALDVSGFSDVMNRHNLTVDSSLDCLDLSSGEESRLMIARALYRGANILFMDEALSKLDLLSAKAVLSAIQEEYTGMCLFIVTHRIEELSDVNYQSILLTSDSSKVVERVE
ncbi:ATP-binding cassette domain-containing protein [Teredinibacter waterburyi]|uniref:ATP-binding cassette domain-containing protein n=1 Tax=Teredinibacter waterburyi TaxID=1500538 RepID=UPI00165F2901|nr:ABC transporter ATP-binding protein [Teredinibacter waterburyi]